MSRKEYVQALHEWLEPASACDLIYTQFKERTQKPGEVYDLYLRDKYYLFIRSFPNWKTRIFKEFCESSIREDNTMKSWETKHTTLYQYNRSMGLKFKRLINWDESYKFQLKTFKLEPLQASLMHQMQ